MRDFDQVPLNVCDRIPVQYLQHAYFRSGSDPGEVAQNMGWFCAKKRTPDIGRVLRFLGFVKKDGAYKEFINYDDALLLLGAMHFDPCDYGL